MTVLAIDTSENCCSAALVRDGQVLAVRVEDIGRGHAERLLPLIDEALQEAGLVYADISRIGVTTGPGTFTGLRIGLSVARGLALALDVPCIGLSGLVVLAAQAGSAVFVHALITGRGGQAYHQAFDCAMGTVPAPVSEAGSFDIAEIEAKIAAQPGQLIGSGTGLLPSRSGIQAAVDPVCLAQLAERLDPAGHEPEPAYLRDADAAKARRLLPVAP